jgi:hypothetical protein
MTFFSHSGFIDWILRVPQRPRFSRLLYHGAIGRWSTHLHTHVHTQTDTHLDFMWSSVSKHCLSVQQWDSGHWEACPCWGLWDWSLPSLLLPTMIFCLNTSPKEWVETNKFMETPKTVSQNKTFLFISWSSQLFVIAMEKWKNGFKKVYTN